MSGWWPSSTTRGSPSSSPTRWPWPRYRSVTATPSRTSRTTSGEWRTSASSTSTATRSWPTSRSRSWESRSSSAAEFPQVESQRGEEAVGRRQREADDVGVVAEDLLDEERPQPLHGVGAGLVERLAGADIPGDLLSAHRCHPHPRALHRGGQRGERPGLPRALGREVTEHGEAGQ